MIENLDSISLAELTGGVGAGSSPGSFTCLECGAAFNADEVYPVEGRFFTAEKAACHHAAHAHGDRLAHLLDTDARYVALTDNQKELLRLLAQGRTDAEIARKTGTSPATVRRQRFTFREKAKQAKLYLAIYQLAMQDGGSARDALVPILGGVPEGDERFLITTAEYASYVKNAFESTQPLRLRALPAKEKRKIAVLNEIVKQFDPAREYTEKEVNSLLRAIHPQEYVTLRRYLIEYSFMQRERDGSRYRVAQKENA